MANAKEIKRSDLENALNTQFPNEDISKLLIEIDNAKASIETATEKQPLFYGEVLKVISSSASIAEWTKSDGINKINSIAKAVKKETDKIKKEEQDKKEAEDKQNEYREKLAKELEEEQKREEFRAKLAEIDFNDITQDDLLYIAQNMERFYDESTLEQYSSTVDIYGAQLGLDKTFIDFLKIAKAVKERANNPDIELSNEDLQNYPDELKTDTGEIDQKKVKYVNSIIGNVYDLCYTSLYQFKEPLTEDKIKQILSGLEIANIVPTEFLERTFIKPMVEHFKDKTLEEQQAQMEEIRNQFNAERQHQVKEATASKEKTIPQMQAENNAILDSQYSRAQDFFVEPTISDTRSSEIFEESENIFAGLDDEFFAALEESDKEVSESMEGEDLPKDEHTSTETEEQTQENVTDMEGTEVRADEQQHSEIIEEQEDHDLKDYEMEVEAPTGIAGFFATVKNKVTGFFQRLGKGKEQKSLPEAQNQRTENGVTITDYGEGNGSLTPLNIRIRNALTNLSVGTIGNAMQAIGKVVGINNSEEAKNTLAPQIMRSDRSQERDEQQQTNDNIPMNAFDKQYNLHSKDSKYYRTDEEIAAGEARAVALSEQAAEKGRLLKEQGISQEDIDQDEIGKD